MNVKYYYEFKGHDDILNRVEILTTDVAVPQEITVSYTPFVLEYSQVKKLEPIQGSGATLGLISNTIFQFESLHTDDMQKYLVKFFRDGALYWMGWLDPELYEENLALYPPYPVEFTAADFNVLERLEFKDNNGKNYSDINSFIAQLKRCFDKLALPFDKLFIGCTTIAEGITLSSSETILHKLYIQSANFYDEDNKAMSCMEVVESILRPFGLMMVQRDSNVYIYDYNSVLLIGKMKMYNFSSLSYVSDVDVSFLLGDLFDIGFRSENAPYGFEDMINNVSITSSIYAIKVKENAKLQVKNLSDKIDAGSSGDRVFYRKSKDIESANEDSFFAIYYGRTIMDYVGQRDSIMGCYSSYLPEVNDVYPLYRVRYKNYLTKVNRSDDGHSYPYYINLKMQAYASTAAHPILHDKAEGVSNSEVIELYCNLYVVDDNGIPIAYYSILSTDSPQWTKVSNGRIEQGKCILWFSNEDSEGSVLDNWIINANKQGIFANKPGSLPASLMNNGLYINPDVSGYLIFEITNKCVILNSDLNKKVDPQKIKMLLYDDINLSVVDQVGDDISTDDYEFRSYIYSKVVTDLEDITLKCISANETKAPAGFANILKMESDYYELQNSYSRSGQTNILERLLLCTIHSNYTRKNKIFTVDIKTTDNPAMRYSTLKSRWPDDKFLTAGCRIDFNRAITNLTVYNFSEDVDKLSEIPYE